MLDNLENYYCYVNLIRTGSIVINTDDITIDNWYSHYNGLMNIFRDGIETNYVQNMFLTVQFGTSGEVIQMHINDYLINMHFWYLILAMGDRKIGPQHIFFEDAFTTKAIKNYVDHHFVIPYRGKINNRTMNRVIANFLENFAAMDEFSMYLANTLNLEDSISLMSVLQEYWDILHHDYSNEPLDTVKQKGNEILKRAEEIIVNAEQYLGYEHCLRAAFKSGEGVNKKQYFENSLSILVKPNGQGGIYNTIINNSYITGGLNKVAYQFIDSASARLAQIISKKNVGDSGGFARILGLNNVSTYLHEDPHFDCGTQNYLLVTIIDKDHLNSVMGRYYKLHEHGQLLCIRENDTHLIGKTIMMRSPIFCASHAAGNGVCYHCYGDLAYTNAEISIGRISSEIITSFEQQIRLSSKHLLEARAKMINWNDAFNMFFELNLNMVELRHDLDYTSFKGWKMVIPFSNIQLESTDDFYTNDFTTEGTPSELQDEAPFFNEYVTEFDIVSPEGAVYNVTSTIEEDGVIEDNHPSKLYITTEMANLIKKNFSIDNDNDDIVIELNELSEINIFTIIIENRDIYKALDRVNFILNKKDITKSFNNMNDLVHQLYISGRDGGLKCSTIHLETLLANQVSSVDDHLIKPNWYNKNEPYTILTLNEALRDNPSPIISLTYCKLADALKYPLTFKKFGSSGFDLFFMRKPMKFLHADHEILDIPNQPRIQKGDSPVLYAHNDEKKSSYHPVDVEKFIEPFNPRPKTRLED